MGPHRWRVLALTIQHERRSDARSVLQPFQTMTHSEALRAATIGTLVAFVAPLALIFLASLAAEDQRAFLSCRRAGQSVDACMLQIHGR